MNYGKPLSLQKSTLEDQNESIKACFDTIYTQKDPREYYRVLYGLDYIIPDLARGIFRRASHALSDLRQRPIKVLDLGCSYGINAVLLRTPLDLDRIASRYAELAPFGLSTERLAGLDRSYFRSWPHRDINVVGLDISASAIEYAKRTEVIDDGIALDLENGELDEHARKLLRDVDLVISTGCVGYITERTFAKILDAIEGPAPWVASFVLRMYPYDAIVDELSRRDLATEKLEGATFVQRRFHSEQECWDVLHCLDQLGVSTDDKEADGLLHAEFFLSRTAADAERIPLQSVASVTTGGQHTFGRRYRRIGDNELLFGKYTSTTLL